MSNPELKLEIPEGAIKAAIATAVLNSFTPEKREEMLADVIRAYMTTKRDRWSKQTLLEEEISKELGKTAMEAVISHIQTWRDDLASKISGKLDLYKEQLINQFAEAVSRATISNVTVSVRFDE